MNDLVAFTQDILHRNDIPCRVERTPLADGNWLDLGLRSQLFGIQNMTEKANESLRALERPILLYTTDLFQLHSIVLSLPEKDEWFFCGPVLFHSVSEEQLQKISERLHLSEAGVQSLRRFYGNLCVMPKLVQYDGLFPVLADRLHGAGNYAVQYQDEEALSEYLGFKSSYLQVAGEPLLSVEVLERRYALENSLLYAVSRASERKALEILAEMLALPHPPERLSDRVRDEKNLIIALNTLLRKAAESAGVHPVHVDGYSSHVIKTLEALNDPEALNGFCRRLVLGYCRLVRRYTMKNYSLLVQKVVNYVNTDLQADLTLNAMATRLSVSPSYLSSLFKKEMGVSLTDYVNGCRIDHAKMLLLWSELPLKQVALQCGVEDLYYFSRMFKRFTGQTPRTWQQAERQRLQEP